MTNAVDTPSPRLRMSHTVDRECCTLTQRCNSRNCGHALFLSALGDLVANTPTGIAEPWQQDEQSLGQTAGTSTRTPPQVRREALSDGRCRSPSLQ